MILGRRKLSIVQELEKAIKSACKGDIRFNLRYSRVIQSSQEMMDYLSVHLQGNIPKLSSNEKLKGFTRRRTGKLRFSNDLTAFDYAKVFFNGAAYYTEASSVLEICRALLAYILPFERIGKVTISGTDYFQRFTFGHRTVPDAPVIYRTDNEQSNNWKDYLWLNSYCG